MQHLATQLKLSLQHLLSRKGELLAVGLTFSVFGKGSGSSNSRGIETRALHYPCLVVMHWRSCSLACKHMWQCSCLCDKQHTSYTCFFERVTCGSSHHLRFCSHFECTRHVMLLLLPLLQVACGDVHAALQHH
jgi:hypothetical protein